MRDSYCKPWNGLMIVYAFARSHETSVLQVDQYAMLLTSVSRYQWTFRLLSLPLAFPLCCFVFLSS